MVLEEVMKVVMVMVMEAVFTLCPSNLNISVYLGGREQSVCTATLLG